MKTILNMAAALLVVIAAAGCKQAPQYALTDGQWVMTAWYDGDGAEHMVTQNRPTMTFAADSTLSGNAGCNNFSGTYTADKEKITIDLGAMTRKMCLDMEIENRLAGKMPTVVRYAIEGNHLMLYNAADKEIFRFGNSVQQADQQAE
jgi:heat shock protein HslJ